MSPEVLNLELGDNRRAFQYRKGTIDELGIVQAFKVGGCNFSGLRRGNELSVHYERSCSDGKKPLIIDTGAGIGASVIYFHFSFPKARLVATEADPANFKLLSSNVVGLPVDCLNAMLVGEASGPQGRHDSSYVTPDYLLERFAESAAPFIMKIDLENSDEGLFVGNMNWIQRIPVLIVALQDVLIPGSERVRRFVKCISELDRDLVYIQDNLFSISRQL